VAWSLKSALNGIYINFASTVFFDGQRATRQRETLANQLADISFGHLPLTHENWENLTLQHLLDSVFV